MSEAEYFDLYDASGRPIGGSKSRSGVHHDGDWHRSAHVWIYTASARLLMQRRTPDKDTWPGRLDASIGGHYRAGEGGPDGVVREAGEELGLKITTAELVWLGLRRVESIEPGVIDHELQDIYLLRRDAPLTEYHPNPVEIAELDFLDARQAARLHAGELDSIEAEALETGATRTRPTTLTSADLIPGRGTYIAAIAHALDDLLAGRHPETIAW